MPNFRLSFSAAAVALALASGNVAAQFDGFYVFGDSLSDNGSYKPVLPPGTGLFTTNPGPIWVSVLADRYGLTAGPANQGGTDYAQGGARVTQLPGVPDMPPTGSAVPIATQVTQFLGAGVVNPNALYSVWGGANDIFYQLGAFQQGAITQAQLQANVAAAATELAAQVARLDAAGARNIVVLSVPDIGKSPFGTASGQAAQITALTALYNSTLNASLQALDVQAIVISPFALLNEVAANPAAYGFSNATGTACGTTPSLLCTPANLVAPDAAQTYVFADGVHPTTGAHNIVAQFVASFIEAPAQMSSLAFAPLAVEEANFRAIDGRMWSGVNSPRPVRKLEMWAAYDYSQNDINGPFLSGKADLNTIAAGGDIKLSDRLIAGASFGYTENKGDFGAGAGGYKLRETAGNVYVGYGMGPWYVGGFLGGANLDYDTHRNLQLGAMSRTESGDTTGWQYWASLVGGYWFNPTGTWQHGPFGRLTYQDVRVHGFSENGSDSTALSYGEQKRESFVTSVGWQATGQVGMFRPFGRITWEYESQDGQSSVSATPIGLNTSYVVAGIKPDDNYFRYLVGGSADFGGVTGFLTAGGTFSNSNGNGYAITVGVRIPM
jgi:outer membrane lipase/esterase